MATTRTGRSVRLLLGGGRDGRRYVDVSLNRRYGVVFRDGRATVHQLEPARANSEVRSTPCHQFIAAAEYFYPLSVFDSDRLVACSRCFG